ncbi:polysaccharide biosynthesis C-terminal domain-containing protein [uncultured Aquimarina sp.]|uniref:MATE family efflux transporter n=1 Tax=uncultured Aquimarina sp. TaxID=575652 RepID=UPI00260D857C|nr:polysaccharide biosynthesis C-terminal domain-containing protein [uncultured Aquimarina sp.]
MKLDKIAYVKMLRKWIDFEVAKNAFGTLLTKVIGLLGGFVFTLLVSNFFGLNSLGVYVTIFSLLNIIVIFGKFGLDTAAVSVLSKQESIKLKQMIYKGLLYKVILISIVVSLIYYFTADFLVANLLNSPELLDLVKISTFAILPYSIFYLNIETLRVFNRITTYSFMYTSIIVIFNILFIVPLIVFKDSLQETLLIYTLIGSVLLSFFISCFYIWKVVFNNSLKILISTNSKIEMKYLKLSFPLLLSGALYMLMNRMDVLMLSSFCDSAIVGSYNIILKFSSLLPIGVMATNAMAGPKYSMLCAKGDFKQMEKISINSSKLILIIAAGVLVILLLFRLEFLSMFKVEINEVIIPYIVAILFSFLYSATGAVGLILQMTGKQNVQMKASILALFINIMLNYFLIPAYGLIGAIIATYTSLTLLNIVLMYIVKKSYGINTLIRI